MLPLNFILQILAQEESVLSLVRPEQSRHLSTQICRDSVGVARGPGVKDTRGSPETFREY